jgi:hypothetical protein
VDVSGLSVCRDQSVMVGINLAVCSQAARSVMNEK